MTPAEFAAEVAQRLNADWPHSPPSKVTLARIWERTQDFPCGAVVGALEVWEAEGERFPPNGPQLRRKVIELMLDAPDWADVLVQLTRLVGAGLGGPYARFEQYQADIAKILGEQPEIVRTFVERVGARQLYEHLQDENGKARLRVMWEQHLDRATREETVAGLPSGGLTTLNRVNREPRQLARVIEAMKSLPERTGK